MYIAHETFQTCNVKCVAKPADVATGDVYESRRSDSGYEVKPHMHTRLW